MSEPIWVETARRMHANGSTVADICEALKRKRDTVRYHLNIGGRRDQKLRHDAERKARAKLVSKGIIAPTLKPAPVVAAPEPPRLTTITLPAVSIQSARIDEIAPPRRFAPKTHCRIDPPGVIRIKQIEAEMIRRGKLRPAGRDLVSELH